MVFRLTGALILAGLLMIGYLSDDRQAARRGAESGVVDEV